MGGVREEGLEVMVGKVVFVKLLKCCVSNICVGWVSACVVCWLGDTSLKIY
jgi:hypothetical protein